MKPVDLSPELEQFKGLWVALIDSDKVISSHKSAQEAYKEALKKGCKEPILFKVPKHDLPHVGQRSMVHTFKYQTIGSSRLPRPFIPLTLRYKDRAVKIKALVDSRADFCMFDGELLYMLDIDLTKLEKIIINGVSRAAAGYVAHIEVGVEDQFFPSPAVFSFDFSPDEFGGLAGQLGFFDTYIVEFNREEMNVALKQSPIPSSRQKASIVRRQLSIVLIALLFLMLASL